MGHHAYTNVDQQDPDLSECPSSGEIVLNRRAESRGIGTQQLASLILPSRSAFRLQSASGAKSCSL